MHRINRWKRQADAIANSKLAARGLSLYWGIEKRFIPFEVDVARALAEYENRLDAERG